MGGLTRVIDQGVIAHISDVCDSTGSISYVVNPAFAPRKPANSFLFPLLRGLYVHSCIPKIILFAPCSPLYGPGAGVTAAVTLVKARAGK